VEEHELREQTIYLVKHGSVAYGTNTPASDVDEKGVAIMSNPAYYFGFKKFEQKDSGWIDKTDRVIYDLRKFISLAVDCNPNIVEVLFVDRSDVLKMTSLGSKLLSMRDLFISQKAAHTFGGYAHSQLKRIEGHYRWLNNPPEEPRLNDFMRASFIGPQDKFTKTFGGHRISVLTCDAALVYHTDMEAYDAAMKDWKNYLNWKENRNVARAAIEAQYGYDCKHAYHLIRLLRMAKEIISTGEVIVKRPDREELLAIRNGAYSYKDLLRMAEEIKMGIDIILPTSPIPREAPRKVIEKITQELIEMAMDEPAAFKAYESFQ
jgi:predicted nucleotidyltransferase